MFKNTKWRDLIPILWILFYSSEINKKNTTHHRIISLLLWKQWAFSWFWRVDIWRRKCRASRTRFHAAFSEFKVCVFLLNVLLYLLVIFWKTRIDIYITWRKYMRRTFKCTCTDIDPHKKNLHSPNPLHPCLVPHQ